MFPVFLFSQHTANYVDSGNSVLNAGDTLYSHAASLSSQDAEGSIVNNMLTGN